MTKTQLMRHAVKLWQVPHVPREINRANARKWLAAVERLGDKMHKLVHELNRDE